LSAGPTPHTRPEEWTFALEAEDGSKIASWTWDEFRALGPTEITVDIHCVTRWSMFATDWRGITVERIFTAAGLAEPRCPPSEACWRPHDRTGRASGFSSRL